MAERGSLSITSTIDYLSSALTVADPCWLILNIIYVYKKRGFISGY